MRLGSHSVPFRVLLAGVSLLGLGVAAVLPTVADDLVGGADPIITSSVGETATAMPVQTDLPAPTQVEASAAPRQVLPQGADTQLATPLPSDTPMRESELAAQSDAMAPARPRRADPAEGLTIDGEEAGITASLAGEASDAGGIVLALDHARVMRVVGDIATIIIGNPAIADASMPDRGTIVLTGKSYGETNMVMLDAGGNILAEQVLRVTVRGQSLVSVYRGVQRTTLSCSPTCEIRPTPGDSAETVSAGLDAFQARNNAALNAARNE